MTLLCYQSCLVSDFIERCSWWCMTSINFELGDLPGTFFFTCDIGVSLI